MATTLLIISNTHATNETVFPDKSSKLMRDFVPIAPNFYADLVMVVHPSVPAKDVKKFIALAKSKPGSLNYASSGIGSNYHMTGELFKSMTATDIVLRRRRSFPSGRRTARDCSVHHLGGRPAASFARRLMLSVSNVGLPPTPGFIA